MSDLVVRRLLIDLDTPPRRHWCGGDAFRTAWCNAWLRDNATQFEPVARPGPATAAAST